MLAPFVRVFCRRNMLSPSDNSKVREIGLVKSDKPAACLPHPDQFSQRAPAFAGLPRNHGRLIQLDFLHVPTGNHRCGTTLASIWTNLDPEAVYGRRTVSPPPPPIEEKTRRRRQRFRCWVMRTRKRTRLSATPTARSVKKEPGIIDGRMVDRNAFSRLPRV